MSRLTDRLVQRACQSARARIRFVPRLKDVPAALGSWAAALSLQAWVFKVFADKDIYFEMAEGEAEPWPGGRYYGSE